MRNKRLIKIIFALAAIIILIAVIFALLKSQAIPELPAPITPPVSENGTGNNNEPPPAPTQTAPKSEVLAENLEIPWALEFLSDGRIIFTERPGNVKIFDPATKKVSTITKIAEVNHIGEGGLHGVALRPNTTNQIYLYYTYAESGNVLNKVVRYILAGDKLNFDKEIIKGIPGKSTHNGGRIKFGPDGMLYIGAGDAQNPDASQNSQAISGKILRLTPEGEIPADNPFNNAVYSYGHRNPQGLAWDSTGQLWATEHGSNTRDEVNKITKGANYGWPLIRGDDTRSGMVLPFKHSGDDTWAPSGLAAVGNTLYFVGLRGSSLFKLDTKTVKLERYLRNEFGRLREVVVGSDGLLYLFTNNRDGRGNPVSTDDRLIRINPEKL